MYQFRATESECERAPIVLVLSGAPHIFPPTKTNTNRGELSPRRLRLLGGPPPPSLSQLVPYINNSNQIIQSFATFNSRVFREFFFHRPSDAAQGFQAIVSGLGEQKRLRRCNRWDYAGDKSRSYALRKSVDDTAVITPRRRLLPLAGGVTSGICNDDGAHVVGVALS